jgi:hypothetical protein
MRVADKLDWKGLRVGDFEQGNKLGIFKWTQKFLVFMEKGYVIISLI